MNINIYKKTLKDKYINKIDYPSVGSWVLIEFINKENIDYLIEKFNLDRNSLEDLLDEFTQPRVEIIENSLYIFLRFPNYQSGQIKLSPILIILSPKLIFTIMTGKTDIFNPIINNNILDITTTQKTRFFLLILSLINSEYRKILIKLSRQIEEYYYLFASKVKKEEISEISNLEIILSNVLSILISIYKVYEKLLFKKYLDFLQEEKSNVDDLSFDILELIEIVKSNIKRTSVIKENFQTMINLLINERILFLTIITVILFVPTIIFSFYGMNIPLPFQDKAWAAFLITFINLILVLLILVFIKRILK